MSPKLILAIGYGLNIKSLTHSIEVIPIRFPGVPEWVLPRSIRRHEMHKVQRTIQQPNMGHVGGIIQWDLYLVEHVLIPFLHSRGNCVIKFPRWDLLLDIRACSVGGDSGNTDTRGNVHSRSIVPTK
jgi:hypothetical protein